MKKTALMLALYAVLLICFTACGTGPDANDDLTKITMSDDERISYYSELADSDDLPIEYATDPTVLYIIEGSYTLVDKPVLADILNSFNHTYPNMCDKYGKDYYGPYITLNFDATYLGNEPASVAGNTININITWFNNHPDQAGVIVYYIVTTMLDYNSSAPEWLTDSINYYMAAEYSGYGYTLSGRYTGGSYLDGGAVGANFLYWMRFEYNIDIVYCANDTLNSSIWLEDDFWATQTGYTLEQLWAAYKAR